MLEPIDLKPSHLITRAPAPVFDPMAGKDQSIHIAMGMLGLIYTLMASIGLLLIINTLI